LFQTQLNKIDHEDAGRKDYIVASACVGLGDYEYKPEGLHAQCTEKERQTMILPNGSHPTDHVMIGQSINSFY
jgi:hypothetical protein